MATSPIRWYREQSLNPTDWSATTVVNYAVQVASTIIPILLVGLPFGFFVWASVWSTTPGLGGHFSLAGYEQILRIPQLGSMLYNTLFLVVVGTTIALTLGMTIVIAVNKFDVPGASFVSYLIIIQYILPSLILAIGWSLLAGRRGLLNELIIRSGLAATPVISVRNEWGMALVLGLHYSGLVYLLVNGAVASVPRSMEESARVWGATPYQVLKRITLSLSFPSVLIATILVAALHAQNFAAPLILGLPANKFVISTYIYLQVSQFPTNFAVASALGMILVLLVVLALVGQWYIKGQSEGYQTIVGRGAEDTQVQLEMGKRTRAGVIAVLILMAGLIIIPIIYLGMTSFLNRAVGVFSEYTLWTVENYRLIFLGERAFEFWPALTNTLFMAVVGSFFTMILASLISYVIVKGDSAISSFLDIVVLAPIAIPLIVIGVAYLWFFITYNVLGLFGSIWLIIIAIASREIVYGTRAVNSSLQSIGDSLEEAAQLSGANVITILRRIYYPLIKPGFFAGYLIAFIHYFKAFTRPVLLRGSDLHVLSTIMESMYSNGDIAEAAAVATVMTLVIVALLAFTEYFTDIKLTRLS